MNWRNKARLAALIAKLPPGVSHSTYYFLQRHYGTLRKADPTRNLKTGLQILTCIEEQQGKLDGSETFLEVGTGRGLALSFALFLSCAFQIITVDLHPYLKEELVFEELRYIRTHQDLITELFSGRCPTAIFGERLAFLVNAGNDVNRLLSGMNVVYLAPANAGQLAFPSHTIDHHVSFGVL